MAGAAAVGAKEAAADVDLLPAKPAYESRSPRATGRLSAGEEADAVEISDHGDHASSGPARPTGGPPAEGSWVARTTSWKGSTKRRSQATRCHAQRTRCQHPHPRNEGPCSDGTR